MALPLGPEKQRTLLEQELPASKEAPVLPVNAPYVLEDRRPKTRRVWATKLLGFVALGFLLNYALSTSTTHKQVVDHAKHYGLTKPKGPLKSTDARKLFFTVPEEESALGASRLYATHPHLAGSGEDFDDAKIILDLFQREFNIVATPELPIYSAGTNLSQYSTKNTINATAPSAWVDVYYPVLNTPLERQLIVLNEDGTEKFNADLVEDGDLRDPEAARYRDAVPTFHGLSRDGDVLGELVYANYGSKEDYNKLVELGVNLTGKIVLTRYGGIFRGLKIKGAEELGAAGVLIYSDPRDDGHVTVENGYEAYPGGPARNPTSVQRGSVQYLSSYPGDPTTPGYPAYENATRTEGTNIPKIPSLPISWANAARLLEELGGVEEGRKLNGKSSATKVRLINHVLNKVTKIWNTYASIPGHIKDEVVLIGCHRDAWVMGAADPTSGTVSLREIVRGFGHLLRNGWKPLRTVLFVSWDAEEYGLVGSTEWGEDFADWIQKHVVTYLNVDVSVAGSRWQTSASPSLAHLIQSAALEVPHPTKKHKTLWDAREDTGPFTNGSADTEFMATYAAERAAEERPRPRVAGKKQADLNIPPLGSGSDYTVFLQRLGVASTDQGFGGTPSDGVYHYHSIYDSQHWQEQYADPGFHRHVAVAKHLGLLALSLTDSIILPLNTTQYTLELGSYLDKVEDIASGLTLARSPDFASLRKSIDKLQDASAQLDHEKYKAEKHFLKLLHKLEKRERRRAHHGCRRGKWLRRVASFVKRVFGVSRAHAEAHAAHRVERIVGAVWDAIARDDGVALQTLLHEQGQPGRHGKPDKLLRAFIRAAQRIRKANQKLIGFERGFIDEAGIKDREWYRHLGVAPGKWLGYGATTLPAVTEALTEEKDAKLAEKEAERLAGLLDRISKALKA